MQEQINRYLNLIKLKNKRTIVSLDNFKVASNLHKIQIKNNRIIVKNQTYDTPRKIKTEIYELKNEKFISIDKYYNEKRK